MPDLFEDPRGHVLADLVLSSWSLHPDDLAEAVRTAAGRLGATDAEILLADLEQQSLSPLEPDRDDSLRRLPIDGSPAGEAFRRRDVVELADGDERRIWLPMLNSIDRLGVLGVTVRGDHDRRGLLALASLAGELVSAKSAYGDRLLLSRRTRSMTLAAEMRWSMLPPPTFTSPEVTVAGIFEPAYEIAGDTFDYAINGGCVHLAILDAMGHGLEASHMATVAVASYRHSRRLGRTMTETVHDMDEVIADRFGASRYVTGQLANLDVELGLFSMLNLGHPLPLHIRGSDVLGELPFAPALPAGLGSKPGKVVEVQLQPGDAVLLHTDGISEARRPGKDAFGMERFTGLVSSLLAAGQPPEELLRNVVNDVVAYQDFRTRDDATLLMVGWRLPGARLTRRQGA